MESNILGNGPDQENILQNMDQSISRDPRRGRDYLGEIPPDNVNYHLEQVIPNYHDEGAS